MGSCSSADSGEPHTLAPRLMCATDLLSRLYWLARQLLHGSNSRQNQAHPSVVGDPSPDPPPRVRWESGLTQPSAGAPSPGAAWPWSACSSSPEFPFYCNCRLHVSLCESKPKPWSLRCSQRSALLQTPARSKAQSPPRPPTKNSRWTGPARGRGQLKRRASESYPGPGSATQYAQAADIQRRAQHNRAWGP